MKITRTFEHSDRYRYDFKLCTTSNGFAQVDTSQDAWYFGTWANPFTLKIVCYCEGDVIITDADNPEEFAAEIQKMRDWNIEQGHRFIGIDPGFNNELKKQFRAVGLSEFLH